jgi:hypothetical protein
MIRFLAALILLISVPKLSEAYSILTHEAVIDNTWDKQLVPLIKQKYPGTTPEQLKKARAYAYGGAIMPDMGYFPFGSRFFTNLVHYTRSGDFVEALISEAQDINEYAFALGALAHYNADNYGHPEGVNVSVGEVYPRMKRKYGDTITYEQDHLSHRRMELGFDVLQVARGNYADSNYVDLIGFEVATPVLERAFEKTYALKLTDVFASLDLAVASFRWSVKDIFPTITRAAWVNKRDEIQKQHPGITRKQYSYKVNKTQYVKTWSKVPWNVRATSMVIKIMPNLVVGRSLRFKVPTPEAEKRFIKSFDDVVINYSKRLQDIREGKKIELVNMDFDTGKPSHAGEYKLADETYQQLMDKLAEKKFEGITPSLERSILDFYAGTYGFTAHSIADLYPKLENGQASK